LARVLMDETGDSLRWEAHPPAAMNAAIQLDRSALRVKPCDKHISETLELVSQMMDLADQGDLDREDVGCGVLYGTLRDAAFKIKKMAEQEKLNHQKKVG